MEHLCLGETDCDILKAYCISRLIVTRPCRILTDLGIRLKHDKTEQETTCGQQRFVPLVEGLETTIPLLPQNPNFFMGYDAEIV